MYFDKHTKFNNSSSNNNNNNAIITATTTTIPTTTGVDQNTVLRCTVMANGKTKVISFQRKMGLPALTTLACEKLGVKNGRYSISANRVPIL